MNGGGIAFGNGFDSYIIAHVFFLSQPFSGCVQKRQLVRRITRQCLKLHLPCGKELLELLLVTDGRELREARIHHLSTQGDHKRSGFDALLTHNLQENRRKRSREGTGIIDVEGRQLSAAVGGEHKIALTAQRILGQERL